MPFPRHYSINHYKLLGLVVGMVCDTVLLAVDRIEPAAGAAILSGAMMYLVGNGVNARSKRPTDPSIIQASPAAEPE